MIENNPSLDLDFRATMDKLGFYVAVQYKNMYQWRRCFDNYKVSVTVERDADSCLGGFRLIVAAHSDAMDVEYNYDFGGYVICRDLSTIGDDIERAKSKLRGEVLDKINDLQKFADSI